MSDFRRNREEWEELWRLGDGYAQPSTKDIDAFFRTGETEISTVLSWTTLARNNTALDFGCGLGRLSRALASRFGEVYGLDISDRLIEKAKEVNKNWPNIHFILNDKGDLSMFDDEYFDFIYSARVFQHFPSKEVIAHYIGELIRVLHPGGALAFQAPSYKRSPFTGLNGMRAYGILRPVVGERVASKFLMRMIAISSKEVKKIVDGYGGEVVQEKEDSLGWYGDFPSELYFVSRGARRA